MIRVLAHRGANRMARENTVAAFRAAAALGADGVELDVRASADGRLVVHHDAAVEGLGQIGELAGSALPNWLPTLPEALDACADLGLVNVEIKADAAPPGLAEAVAGLLASRPPTPELLVSSFDLAVIDAHRAIAPGLPTGWLCALPLDAGEVVATLVARGHVALHPHHLLVNAPLISAAHDAGVSVVAWTINEPGRAVELAALGVDVIISDVPDAILHALGITKPSASGS